MSNLAQAILITLGVAVGSGVGTTVAVKIALPEAPAPAAATPEPGAQQAIVDENGPSAADYLAAGMACSDLQRFGKTEEEAVARVGARARFLIATVKAAGFEVEDCQ
jgi:hypothetical protein